jgi:ethanolamine ammonia-lyase large subunit
MNELYKLILVDSATSFAISEIREQLASRIRDIVADAMTNAATVFGEQPVQIIVAIRPGDWQGEA